jgi:hypothetical protein
MISKGGRKEGRKDTKCRKARCTRKEGRRKEEHRRM